MRRFLPSAILLLAYAAPAQSAPTPMVAARPATPQVGDLPQTPKSIPAANNYSGGGSSPTLPVPSGIAYVGTSASADDGFNVQCYRLANYTGGTNGQVNNCFLAYTRAVAGERAYEWPFECALDNYSTQSDGSENVACQGSATKVGSGATWAANWNLADTHADPATTSVTVEPDLSAVGTDVNNQRAIYDFWGKSYDGSNDTISKAIRFNSDSRTRFGDIIQFNLGARGCTNFINDAATGTFKIDCSGNVTSAAASLSTWGGKDGISGYTPGGSAIIGTGGTVTTAASHFNTSADGTITITTGSGISAAGLVLTINFADTRARVPNCVVSGGGPTNPGFYASGWSISAVSISAVSPLNTAATYELAYICGGN